jgi:ABC-type nitrate/sulfonate/bicarbonate transport system substrate-binding protein
MTKPVAEPEPLTPVVMQLDWIYNAQFAGIFQAMEQGYFADAGIELEVRGGPTTDDVVRATLEEPKISFGSSESNVLIAEAAEGKDLKMLGTMFQFSPMGWMYLGGGDINEFTDLADKNVGVHVDGWRVIKLLLQKQGADISNLNTFECGYSPSVVIDGEADAMQCYYIDEYVRFQQLEGDRAKVFLAKDFGYEAYSQVVFTASDTIAEHPEVVASFMKALKMGWAYAFENPEATVDMLIAKYNPELERDYQLRSLAKIEDLMVPEPGALFRPIKPEVLQASVDYLIGYDLISKSVDVDSLLAQSFLPE